MGFCCVDIFVKLRYDRSMERKVDLVHLENRYFERMASSLGDKTRLLKYLPEIVDTANPPHILDVGAGGGDFAHALSLLGYRVTALDVSEEAIEHIKFNYSDVETMKALANESHLLGENKYDAVVCSSILHEVFSYGDNFHKAGHYSSIERALDSFRHALKENGVLIIRDGVLPDDWEKVGAITILDADDTVVEKYLEMCPFAHGHVNHKASQHLVDLRKVAPNTWVGNYRSLMEFSYTYTWGVDSYPRETQELYGLYTLDGYADVINRNGFTVIEKYKYLQPGYVEGLKTKVALNAPDRDNKWFDSNAVWVAKKVADNI